MISLPVTANTRFIAELPRKYSGIFRVLLTSNTVCTSDNSTNPVFVISTDLRIAVEERVVLAGAKTAVDIVLEICRKREEEREKIEWEKITNSIKFDNIKFLRPRNGQ